MTPAQIEHLKLIDAHLERLIAIAEKRTPGEWIRPSQYATHLTCALSRNHGGLVCDFPDSTPDGSQHGPDAAFIASCAGNAEAGWKALRDEVRDYIEQYEALPGKRWPYGEKRVASILAAFPLELIQKP